MGKLRESAPVPGSTFEGVLQASARRRDRDGDGGKRNGTAAAGASNRAGRSQAARAAATAAPQVDGDDGGDAARGAVLTEESRADRAAAGRDDAPAARFDPAALDAAQAQAWAALSARERKALGYSRAERSALNKAAWALRITGEIACWGLNDDGQSDAPPR